MANLQIRVVVVEKGDTLWGIAERELGNGQRWREVFQWNVIAWMENTPVPERVSADYIVPGQKVKILIPRPAFEPSGN